MRSAAAVAEHAGSLAFTALAGLEKAKEALLLLAVDPGLKGVLIAGGPGTAKSSLVRAFRSLFDQPFVELPLGVTEDRLIGGLDFERTLRTGRLRLLPGLLARADGGVLVADEVHRLEPWQARVIASSLRSGRVVVEREGASVTQPSRFVLLGTYDPREGPVDANIRDAVGLHVCAGQLATREERAALLARLFRLCEPEAPEAITRLRAQIRASRRRLGRIPWSEEALRRLAEAASDAGLEGHRVDWFAARAARARAALLGRRRIDETDLETAIELVVAPRIDADTAAPTPPGELPEACQEATRGESAEMAVDPEDCQEPQGALELSGADGPGRRARAGKSGRPFGHLSRRGRYAGATPHRRRGARVALGPTLRAAALTAASRGQRTLPLQVGAGDLRFQRLHERSSVLVIFLIDTSGSMAANRIAQAKGALLRLLRRAYIHRDRVALVSFRGSHAEIALPPTRSVERAMEAVARLRVGGGTPLACGLAEALRMARAARRTGEPVLLVLLTDGRANVPGRSGGETVWAELAELGAEIQACGAESVVIGATRPFGSTEAQHLARLLGGRFVPLEPGGAEADEAVACFTERLRKA